MKIDPFSDPQKAFWTFINVHFDCWQGPKTVKKVQNGWSQMKKLETGFRPFDCIVQKHVF